MQVRRTFLFNTKRDSKILEWLDQQDNASEAVRDALRLAIGEKKTKITLEDIYAELQDLKRYGVTISDGKNNVITDEPPDIVANLDKLGL